MAFYKLYLVFLVSFLVHLSSSTIAARQPSYEYGITKKEGETNFTPSAIRRSTCESASEGGIVHLSCPGAKISRIIFASFGNPRGFCGGSLSKANCDAPNTVSVVQKECVGKESCEISATRAQFGPNSCTGTLELVVEAAC